MGAERRTGPDVVAAAAAFLVPVAYLPLVDAPFWSPKAAVVLPAAAIGLTRLPALLRTRLRPAALAALAFLSVATVSTVLSDDVRQATFGLYNWGTGLVFVLALVGCWALGASVTPAGRRSVTAGLVAGTAISSAVGALQLVVDLGVPFLGSPEGGRATGLAGNPVHLAALALGVLAMAAAKAGERSWWLVAVGAGAAAIQLSGSRFALLLLVPLVLALAAHRGLRPSAVVVAAIVLGLAVGGAVTSVAGQGTSSSGRVAALGASRGGFTARLETWTSSAHAVAERPVLGAGPGRFRAATSPHRTLALARAEGPDRLFEDGHNLAVEHAVTTGVLGVLALGAWLVLAAGAVRSVPIASFGVAVLGLHLVQPQSVGTTTLALLALGAASVGGEAAERPTGRGRRLAPAVAGALGAVLGGVLVTGDAALQRARLDFDDAASRSATSLLAPWPAPATVRARLFAFEALSDPGGPAQDEAVRWRRIASSRARDSPRLASELAEALLAAGREADALHELRRVVLLDPWSRRGWEAIARLSPDPAERRLAESRVELLLG